MVSKSADKAKNVHRKITCKAFWRPAINFWLSNLEGLAYVKYLEVPKSVILNHWLTGELLFAFINLVVYV